MKKHFIKKDKNEKGKLHGKWSEGFSKSKGKGKSDSPKPKKADDVYFEDDSVILIDEKVEVASINGKAQFFAIEGASLKVNGKRIV